MVGPGGEAGDGAVSGLSYRVFDKDQRVTHAAITENERLGDVLAYIKERQDQRPPTEDQDQQREDRLQAAGG
jgi:hypothetical protein